MLAQPRIDLDVPRAHEGSLVDAIALSLSTPGALLHKTIEVRSWAQTAKLDTCLSSMPAKG